MRLAVVIAALVALTACSFIHEQVGITSASDCIRTECRDPDARDYTERSAPAGRGDAGVQSPGTGVSAW